MEFSYNRGKAELLRVMKSKGEKKNIEVKDNGNKISINLITGKFTKGEDTIPVMFHGKISEDEGKCRLSGKFTYGFYLYTLVIVAAILIIARFSWSAYKHQTDNMILCGIVTLLLVIVVSVVLVKSKSGKKVITDFLNDLNLK